MLIKAMHHHWCRARLLGTVPPFFQINFIMSLNVGECIHNRIFVYCFVSYARISDIALLVIGR